MHRTSSIRRVFVAGLLVVALSSCGDDAADDPAEPTDDPAEPTDAAGATEVVIDDFAFVSADITVDVGTAVTWRNDQGVPHTVTGDGGEFDSANLPEGAAFTQDFPDAGTFAYHCEIHPDMTGVVSVQA